MKTHRYEAIIKWTGNKGSGTADYKAYNRDHLISMKGKPDIYGSSDVAFRGDKERYSPEDLLVVSLSACHMLWYLHLCAVNGVVVTAYTDRPEGTMEELTDGSGKFTEVVLHPAVTVSDPAMTGRAETLHPEAHRLCFIARSVNFPVRHKPFITADPTFQ